MISAKIRINVGCGPTPTPGWVNYDNSLSVLFSKKPLFLWLLQCAKLIKPQQQQFVDIAREYSIDHVDAAKGFPHPDQSVNAIYSSHMLEHLDVEEAKHFLSEAYRVLETGGVLRIVVPDLRKLSNAYLEDGDADKFIRNSLLTTMRPISLVERFKYIFVGHRHHLWMYDSQSLVKVLTQMGFIEVRPQDFGSTRILNPGELNLNEREDESICVEAVKP